jgi:peroxiredoxin
MKRILLTLSIMILASLLFADAMPDFRLPDLGGETVALQDLLGKGPC